MRRYPIKTYLKWLVIGLVSILVGRWCRFVPNQPLWSMDATNHIIIGIDEANHELLTLAEAPQSGKEFLVIHSLKSGGELRQVELTKPVAALPTPLRVARPLLQFDQLPIITPAEVIATIHKNQLIHINRKSGMITEAKSDPFEEIYISPTGTYLLTQTDNWSIRTREDQKVVLRNILPDSFVATSPSWSADEATVAFCGHMEKSGRSIRPFMSLRFPRARNER